MSTWLELWPHWAGRWFGWLIRSVVGLIGVLFGAFLILIANFAVGFKATPEWGGEHIVILVFGLVIVGASAWVFARPSKTSLTLLTLALAGVFAGVGL